MITLKHVEVWKGKNYPNSSQQQITPCSLLFRLSIKSLFWVPYVTFTIRKF